MKRHLINRLWQPMMKSRTKEKNMRTYVHVRFKPSDKKTYAYIADGDAEELKQFTHAVVDSPYAALTIVDIIKFSALDESTYNGEYKDVVAMFNLDYYNEKQDKRNRKQAIEKELRRRVAARKLEDNFAELLKNDDEGMKLLEEFKKL